MRSSPGSRTHLSSGLWRSIQDCSATLNVSLSFPIQKVMLSGNCYLLRREWTILNIIVCRGNGRITRPSDFIRLPAAAIAAMDSFMHPAL